LGKKQTALKPWTVNREPKIPWNPFLQTDHGLRITNRHLALSDGGKSCINDPMIPALND